MHFLRILIFGKSTRPKRYSFSVNSFLYIILRRISCSEIQMETLIFFKVKNNWNNIIFLRFFFLRYGFMIMIVIYNDFVQIYIIYIEYRLK